MEAAPELGWDGPGGTFFPQSPNLFWPQDHAWCVASESVVVERYLLSNSAGLRWPKAPNAEGSGCRRPRTTPIAAVNTLPEIQRDVIVGFRRRWTPPRG